MTAIATKPAIAFDPEIHCGTPITSYRGRGEPCRALKGKGPDGLCWQHDGRSLAVAFDPAKHCGAETNPLFNDATPCSQPKGWGTDHVGSGHCRKHLGTSPNGIKAAAKEAAEIAVVKLGLPSGSGDPFALLDKTIRYADSYLDGTGQLLADVVERRNITVSLEAAAAIHVRAIRQASMTGSQAVEADVADRREARNERLGDFVLRFARDLIAQVAPPTAWPDLEAWATGHLRALAAEYESPSGLVH